MFNSLSNNHRNRGVVYVEVLMSLIPLLLAFLGICQLAMIYTGQLVVQHAATRAARAAMVVLEDDPEHYGGAPRGDLQSGEGNSEQGIPQEVLGDQPTAEYEAFSAVAASSNSNDSHGRGSGSGDEIKAGARWAAIRAAAYHPLSVLGPPPSALMGRHLGDEVAGNSMVRILGGRFFYNQGASSVTLHPPEGDELLTEVGPHDMVRVRVSFLMPCGVPLVASLICSNRLSVFLARFGLGDDSEKEMLEKTEHVESPSMRDAILLGMPNLILLTAEASMPNQGADYYPREEQ